jgi:hypothetical protein
MLTKMLLQKIKLKWPRWAGVGATMARPETVVPAVLALLFLALTMFFAHFTPFEFGNYGAPDEVTHYRYNVEAILQHHRLPVPGRDDLSAYRTCYDRPAGLYGQVPCLISYTMYPGLNYILAAGGAAVAQGVLHVSPLWGARAVSWLWGAAFVVFLFLASQLVVGNWRYAVLATAAVAFIPQVLFIASYVNQDIHSLAISALLAYAVLLLYRRGVTRLTVGWFALAFGLAWAVKYNYLIDVPVAVGVVIWLYARGQLAGRQLVTLSWSSAVAALVLSGYWYLRNLVVLHDPLGQSFMLRKMAEFHALGPAHPLNLHALTYLGRLNFFDLSFRSFFGLFGYMDLPLPDGAYELAKFVVLALVVGIVAECLGRRDRRALRVLLALAAFGAVSFGLLVYNTLQLDFQPQGRYLFPVLVPAALTLAYLMKRSPSFIKYGVIGLSLTLFLLGDSVLLYLQTFVKP